MRRNEALTVAVIISMTLVCSTTTLATLFQTGNPAGGKLKWDKDTTFSTWDGSAWTAYGGHGFPTSSDDVLVGDTAAGLPWTSSDNVFTNDPLIIRAGYPAANCKTLRLANMPNTPQGLQIDGTLTVTNQFYLGYVGNANPSYFSSDSIAYTSTVLVHYGGEAGTPNADVNIGSIVNTNGTAGTTFLWTQYGGTVDVGNITLNTSLFSYQLQGGTLTITGSVTGTNMHLNISGGTLTMPNSVFDSLIANGNIIQANGATVNTSNIDILLAIDTTTTPGYTIATLGTIPVELATNVSPVPSATDVDLDANLIWSAGQGALSHDVYFGTDQTAVTNAQRSLGDISGDRFINITDLLTLADQWLNNPGSVNNSADIVFSNHVDIADFAALAYDWQKTPDDEFMGNQISTEFEPGTLSHNTTYFWRIDEVNPSDSDSPYKGIVWSFKTVDLTPGYISEPCPPEGENNIWKGIDLSWNAADNATSYKVYLSTDSTVDAGDYQGTVTDTTYPLNNTLAYNTPYWWRVDAVNDYDTTEGIVYSFITENGAALTPEQFPIVAWDIAKSSAYYEKPVLATMRACGFNVAGIVKPKNLDNVAAAGMKMFIIDYNCPGGYSYPATDALVTADASTINTVVNYEVSNYGNHPATFGYFVRDEPLPDDFDPPSPPSLTSQQLFTGIGNWVDAYRLADPSHKAYVSLGWGYTGYDWSDYLNYVDNDFLSYDWYGVRTDDGDVTQYVEPYYFPILEKARDAADSSSLPLWNMGASIKMYNPDTAMPALANLRFQAFSSLAYGIKGLFWFTYFSDNFTMPAPITNFSKSAFWDDMQAVNMAIHKIGPTYLQLEYANTFHEPTVPTGQSWMDYDSQGISSSWYVSSISGGDYVIGEFTGPSSTKYLMIANKSLTNTASVNISFKSPYNTWTKYYVDDSDGQLKPFTQGQALAPGNGLLLKLVP